MKKNANGAGSIFQRSDGLWCFSYHDPTGKRRTITRKLQKDIIAESKRIISQLERGDYSKPDKVTVETWLKEWLETYHKPAVRESTFATDSIIVSKDILPALGQYRLQTLTVARIQAFVNSLAERLSSSTVKRIVSVFKCAMKQAVLNGILPNNPAQNVKLPKQEQKEIEVFTPEEREKLFAVLPDTTEGRMIKFIFCTGLRVSECIGLRWIDIHGDCITVSNVINIVGHDAPPKSEAGKRTIPLGKKALEIIAKQREKPCVKYVFSTPIGGCIDRNHISRCLRNSLAKAGIPSRGIHAARHTFASMAITGGVDPRTVSEIIGHSKVSTTLQIYAHSNPEIKKSAINLVENAL